MVRRHYGLLLPHFGSNASREAIVSSAQEIERYGFDSVWVRDHVVYRPHPHEDPDITNVDPFVTLTSVAAVTRNLTLATGTLIPHRNPIHAAQLIGSLDFIAGPGRVLIGIGLGNDSTEFDAVGMGGWDRRHVVEEYVSIVRRLLQGEVLTHNGSFYRFSDVRIRPVPDEPVPIWYGGGSAAAVRRAVEYCDGWMPSRIPRFAFAQRMERMRILAESRGTPIPSAGATSYVSPGSSFEEALRPLNLSALTAATKRVYGTGASGSMSSYEDLDGVAIVGSTDQIIDGVRRYEALGAEHFVFDLRPQFHRWRELVAFLGEEVLPLLHEGA